jgi:predicted adenylyl cyclase CyaB
MEIEAKYYFKSQNELDSLCQKLNHLGISLSEEAYQKDVYYKEQGYKDKINGPGSFVLRVRYSPNEPDLFTLKKLTENDGVWIEKETTIGDGKATEDILKHIDLEKAVTVEKLRRKGNYLNFEVIIDKVTDLGTFLEVSVLKYNNIEHAKTQITDFFNEIELNMNNIELRGYPTIFLEQQGVKFTAK